MSNNHRWARIPSLSVLSQLLAEKAVIVEVCPTYNPHNFKAQDAESFKDIVLYTQTEVRLIDPVSFINYEKVSTITYNSILGFKNTQEVLDTAWVRLKANPDEVVEYAFEEGNDWVINTRWGDVYRTSYSSLPDLLMLHIDSNIVRVLKLKANNEVDVFKEFNPLWLWGLFSPQHWVFTAPTCGCSLRVILIQAVEDGFTIHPLTAAVFNPLKVKRFTHLAKHLTLNVPEPVLEIFAAKGQFPYLISNKCED